MTHAGMYHMQTQFARKIIFKSLQLLQMENVAFEVITANLVQI